MDQFKLKDYKLADTIVALATFPSPAALGIIKISGKKAVKIISQIFIAKSSKDINKAKTYTLHYGWISQNKAKKNIIDEVLVSLMLKPHSYTKEDVVEISSHGGLLVINKIITLILKAGGRLALPGEFTYRAFINGRIDLLKAQSVLDIIQARSQQGLKKAVSQLRGDVSLKISKLKEEIKSLFVFIEAYISFPEDQVVIPLKDIKDKLLHIHQEFGKFVKAGQDGQALRQGINCVICGKANVGKSTLFNRLLKEERVIVSEYAGTTRDVVEDTISIKGLTLRLSDTAGIIQTKDFLTQKAISRSKEAINQADITLLVLDNSKVLTREDSALLEKLKDKNVIIVLNKADLASKINLRAIPQNYKVIVKLSALQDFGLHDLEELIYKSLYKKGVKAQDSIFLSQYQRQISQEIYLSLSKIKDFLESGYTIDFIHLELKHCLDNLDKITGDHYSQDMLESIFSQFCIGK